MVIKWICILLLYWIYWIKGRGSHYPVLNFLDFLIYIYPSNYSFHHHFAEYVKAFLNLNPKNVFQSNIKENLRYSQTMLIKIDALSYCRHV